MTGNDDDRETELHLDHDVRAFVIAGRHDR